MTFLKKMKIHEKKKTLNVTTETPSEKAENKREKLKKRKVGKRGSNMNKGENSNAKTDTTSVIKKDNKSTRKKTDFLANGEHSNKLNINSEKGCIGKSEGKSSMKKKKRKLKTDTKHEKREDLESKAPQMGSTSDKTDNKDLKKKTPLTVRQLHKRKKLAEKRKAKREMKKKRKESNNKNSNEKHSKDNSQENTIKNSSTVPSPTMVTDEVKTERIILPKNVVEATSNWRKLQMTMKPKTVRKAQKRKADLTRLRNPKYRKIDEKMISEKIIDEVNKPKKEEKSQEIWFDDIDESLVEDRVDRKAEIKDTSGRKAAPEDDSKLVKPDAFKGLTKLVGMDCEMVGVRNNQSVLARVSIVNRYGEQLYDKFVKPKEKVTDYRTSISGIRPEDLEKGESFNKVRQEVADILKGRVLIGHALKNDLQVLRLHHPKSDIRDTSTFEPFRKLFDNKTPGLRKLTAKVLSVKIQQGEHSSVQDAQAAVRLYMLHKTQWETDIKNSGKTSKKKRKVVKTVLEKDNVDKLEKIDRFWDV